MRIFKVHLPYTYGDDQEQQKAKRLEHFVSLGYKAREQSIRAMNGGEILLTEFQFVESCLKLPDMKIDIVEEVEVFSISDATSALEKIEHVVGKMERFAGSIGNASFNEKVQVYTPGMGLMLFNRTMLLSDACSDALQAELDNGWRIIAACPQPDQRRPDYILGRFEAGDEPGAGRSAKRG